MRWRFVYALLIRASSKLLHAYNGLHMLPNLKILICGVVFGPLLFAVTGAGVLLPDSNTRVGEVPEIGRPMMQRMIAEEPAQAQFRITTVARRSEELERLRELSAVEVAPAQLEPDLLKPAVVENPVSDDVLVTDVAGPVLQPSRAMETASGTASGPLQVRPTETSTNVPPDDAGPMQVATLPATPPDGDLTEHAPSVLNVPLPPLRPIARTSSIPKRVFHRKHRVAQPPTPSDTFGQSLFARPLLGPR
jgi:hypothetical protein